MLYQPDSSIHIEVLVEGETVWLTQQQIAKQYLLRGYAVQRQIQQLERQIDLRLTTLQSHTENQIGEVRRQLLQQQEQLDFFVRTNQPPHEGVVFEVHLLEGREVGVAATIYTEKTGVNIQTLQADHEREYGVGRHM